MGKTTRLYITFRLSTKLQMIHSEVHAKKQNRLFPNKMCLWYKFTIFSAEIEMKCFITSILPFHECLKNSKYGKDTFFCLFVWFGFGFVFWFFFFLNALNSIKSITQTHVWYFSKWSLVMQRSKNLYYEMFIFLHIFLLKLFMKSILSA